MHLFKLFIATSIDGLIAREDGGIDWLDSIPHPENVDYGYVEFMSHIDTVIMGRKTYEDVIGFDVEWPYGDKTCFLVSGSGKVDITTPKTQLISDLSEKSLQKIKNLSHKDIWVIGGGDLIAGFLNQGLIDSMLISIIPVVLGKGRPLFKNGIETSFKLNSTEAFENGIVNLVYERS
ncbi:MAG: dihydrofolate reductase [Bacteroidia bacterium]|jgi:dihydrofolate reductase